MNGSIRIYQSRESGTKPDKTPQFSRSHLCEHKRSNWNSTGPSLQKWPFLWRLVEPVFSVLHLMNNQAAWTLGLSSSLYPTLETGPDHSFGRIQMSVISGIGCDLNPNTAFLSSLGMQEGSRGNTSLVIYIHPSSPHQLVKCPQCGLATKNARCSDIFAAWPWFLLPWGHLWFFSQLLLYLFCWKIPNRRKLKT